MSGVHLEQIDIPLGIVQIDIYDYLKQFALCRLNTKHSDVRTGLHFELMNHYYPFHRLLVTN